MSSNRDRALKYAAEVQSTRFGRKMNKPNNFGNPAPKTGPPSYAFIDQQRSEVDNVSEETKPLRNEEKEIEMNKDRDIVDKDDYVPPTKTGKAPTPHLISKSQQATAPELKSVFRKCWTTVSEIHIPLKSFDAKSFFLPNALMLFRILFDLEETLNGNEDLRWRSPKYFSLPVRVYYAVLFYVQVLRAKEQSGKLKKVEGSWLRAFTRRHKETSLNIAGPLVPYFSNIVSVLPTDDQYDYVYPTIGNKGTYSVDDDAAAKRLPTVLPAHHLTPSVPLITALLKDFCNTPNLDDNKFDTDGNYIPFSLTTGGNFAGVTFPANAGNNQRIANLLTNPVLMRPIPEDKNRLMEIHGYWKTSGIREIPEIPMNVAFEPENPGGWTMMSDDFDWFQKCSDMAAIQCKYFSESTNLSSIPTVGGNSALVVAKIKLDSSSVPPSKVTGWYTDKLSKMKAQFYSHTAELELDDSYQASYALTNAQLSWNVEGNPIGSTDSGLREGPYFDNNKVNYELDYDVSVGAGIYAMIQTLFYEAKN